MNPIGTSDNEYLTDSTQQGHQNKQLLDRGQLVTGIVGTGKFVWCLVECHSLIGVKINIKTVLLCKFI